MSFVVVKVADAVVFMLKLATATAANRDKSCIAANPLLTTPCFDQRDGVIATETAMLARNHLGLHTIVSHGQLLLRQDTPQGPESQCDVSNREKMGSIYVNCKDNFLLSLGYPEPCFTKGQIYDHIFNMSRKYNLERSRDNWKDKAVARAKENRYYRRENSRIKNERDRHKMEAREARKALEQTKQQYLTPSVSDKKDLVYITLQLFLSARISFRAVSRVLRVLGKYLGVEKPPCAQTVINWVTKFSITRIEHASELVGTHGSTRPSISNESIWMIDSSIALGAGKILAVLALDVRHHHLNREAPSLKDVQCIAVSVSVSWTGEKIANFLQKVIAVLGRPSGILKDGGADLSKAVRLLGQKGQFCHEIDDISHVIANLLKHEYAHHSMFQTFVSACGKASQKLKQTLLASLAPPKVSTKARFMNLHRLVGWADKLLKHSPVGRVAKGSMTEKLRECMEQLPQCKGFIKRFLRDATALLDCQKLLKVKGLSSDTSRQCQALISSIPYTSHIRIGFIDWLENQLNIAHILNVEDCGLPCSSDLIESLFGIGKFHGVGEIKDANRIAARLPALCGTVTQEDVERVLQVSVSQQQALLGALPSLTRQRREILPNPGSLEDALSSEDVESCLELIPGTKNRTKNQKTIYISSSYANQSDPDSMTV
jgi:hypothetical protein